MSDTSQADLSGEDEDPFNSCVVHVSASDDDCEYCQAEMQRRHMALEKVMQSNSVRINEAAKLKVGIDKIDVLGVRLDLFIQMVLPDIRQRFIFEQAFHSQISEILTEMEKALTTQKLLKGVPLNNMPNPLGNREQRRKR